MDELSPLIALQFKVENLINDESVYSTRVDITGIDELIANASLFSEPSMTKLPVAPLALENRNSSSPLPHNGVVINIESTRDKAKQSESCLIFSNSIKQEIREDDSTALNGNPLAGIVDSQCAPNDTNIDRYSSIKKSESWVGDLVSLEDKGVGVGVGVGVGTIGQPRRTYSTNSLVEVSEGMKINKQVFPFDFPPLWGSASVCGRRQEMEDAVVALPRFLKIPSQMLSDDPLSSSINQELTAHLFGVYDGHGGCQVANYCRERLHLSLADEVGIAGEKLNTHTENGEHNLKDHWLRVFLKCFHRLDDEVGGFNRVDGNDSAFNPPIAPESVGSTAVVAVLCSTHIIVANCGDSRAVLYRGKVPVPLSVDHKPNREDECARIEAAGGKVINWDGYRVSGVLAVSRSIGDRYLRPYVIAEPEIMCVPRTKEDECLILASDGLWDVMTNDEACDLARRRILLWHKKNGATLSKERGNDVDPAAQDAADYLSKVAFQRGSRDNISVIVVDLKAQRKFKKKT